MESYKKLHESVDKELDKIAVKGTDFSAADVEVLYKLTCIKKNILTIEAMEDEYGDEGYSRDYYPTRSMYRSDHSYGNYNGNYSGTRRDMRTGRYSGHSINDRIIDKLERMMDEADSDYERQEISNWIAKARN